MEIVGQLAKSVGQFVCDTNSKCKRVEYLACSITDEKTDKCRVGALCNHRSALAFISAYRLA